MFWRFTGKWTDRGIKHEIVLVFNESMERRWSMGPNTKQDTETVAKEIKRNTRCKFNPEEKIRIILAGL
jgi:hypothetical protein